VVTAFGLFTFFLAESFSPLHFALLFRIRMHQLSTFLLSAFNQGLDPVFFFFNRVPVGIFSPSPPERGSLQRKRPDRSCNGFCQFSLFYGVTVYKFSPPYGKFRNRPCLRLFSFNLPAAASICSFTRVQMSFREYLSKPVPLFLFRRSRSTPFPFQVYDTVQPF